MIHVVRQLPDPPTQWHYCQIAEQHIAFSEPVDALAAFSVGPSPLRDGDGYAGRANSKHELLTEHNSRVHYQDQLHFNNKMCSVIYRRSELFAQIDIDDHPSCGIDLESSTIVVLNDLPFDGLFNLELITGPALILLLSMRSIYCLHAGAVSIKLDDLSSVNVAFIAESGSGKSTLSKGAGEGWRQCADDILPVAFKPNIQLFDDFPQLKLLNAKVDSESLKNKDLGFIFNIVNQESDAILIEKMTPIDAVLMIVRHTVASRLFEPDVMRHHVEFAQKLANSIGVFQISYPRQLSQLPLLRQTLIEFVSTAREGDLR